MSQCHCYIKLPFVYIMIWLMLILFHIYKEYTLRYNNHIAVSTSVETILWSVLFVLNIKMYSR